MIACLGELLLRLALAARPIPHIVPMRDDHIPRWYRQRLNVSARRQSWPQQPDFLVYLAGNLSHLPLLPTNTVCHVTDLPNIVQDSGQPGYVRRLSNLVQTLSLILQGILRLIKCLSHAALLCCQFLMLCQ